MQKTTFILSLFVILTLTLTSLGIADFEFINQSNKDAWIVYQRWQNADANYPVGYRTKGWYKIKAGQSRSFPAPDTDPDEHQYVYIYVTHPFPSEIRPVDHEDRYSAPSWIHPNRGFTVVEDWDGDILKSSRPKNQLVQKDFYEYEYIDGVPLTLLANGTLEPGDSLTEPDWEEINPPGGGNQPTVAAEEVITSQPTQRTNGLQAKITASVDGRALNTTGTGPIEVKTQSPIQITVQLLLNGQLARGNLFFSLEGPAGATLQKSKGTTDNKAEVDNLLTLGKLEGRYKFIVKAESIIVGADPVTLSELIFKASEGPGAGASKIVISGPRAIDPRGSSSPDGRMSFTFKVTTLAGNPVVNAPIDVRHLSGPKIEKIPEARPRTNTQGEAGITLRLVGGSTGDLKIQASVGDAVGTKTIKVRHSLGSVSFSNGLPSSITSGGKDPIEVTARSRNGTLMSGVDIAFDTTSSNLRVSPSSGETGKTSSGKFSATVKTKGETGKVWVNVTASHTPALGSRVTKTTKASTKVVPKIEERQTAAVYFKSRRDRWWRDWYWTDWKTVSLTRSECNRVVSWWGYAAVSIADDPFVDEENITREDESSIRYDGNRTWEIRVRIKEHRVEANEVWLRAKARCEVLAGTFAAPSLQQPQRHPETHHLSETWQELSQVPSETVLLPNYPNPFNPETWIPYHLAEPADVMLRIYAADGKLVRTLALGHQPAGLYESKSRAAYWDGRNSVGERVASGLYFYTLTARDFAATGKMLIMK